MNNQLVYISQTLYDLKRSYGYPVDIYTTTGSTVNLESGAKTVARDVFKIKKGILLPKRITREFIDGQTFSVGLKNLAYGGSFNLGRRVLIIDIKDYPATYIVKPDDYVVINHERFNIIEAEQFDHRLCVLFNIQEIKNEDINAITSKSLSHRLRIKQNAEGET